MSESDPNRDRRSSRQQATGQVISASRSWVPFEKFARDPFSWVVKADELRLSARILATACYTHYQNVTGSIAMRRKVRGPDAMKSYLLLSAFSIENYLKGLIVQREPNSVRNGQLDGKLLATRDLVLLARSARTRHSEAAKTFLALLTHAAVDFGRYPIARSRKHYASHRIVTGDPIRAVERLSRRLRALLQRRAAIRGATLELPRLPLWRVPKDKREFPVARSWT